MEVLSRLGTARVRSVIWPSLLLIVSLFLGLVSSVASAEGQPYAALTLSFIAIGLAAVAGFFLIPRLLAGLQLDFLNQLRFFRFTRRGAIFLTMVLLVGFSAANTGNNLLILVLSALIASIVVSGTVSNLVLHGIKISLSLPESIHAGQRAVFFLTLHNLKKLFPSFALRLRSHNKQEELEDEVTDFFIQEKSFPYIRPQERLQAELHCEFRRRGIYSIDGFEVTTTFPFGFFSRGRKIDARGSIVVYPVLRDLSSFLRLHPFLKGSRESRHKGWGSGLYNIRPFQGGDSTRFIHWKSTAKVGQLMVKDFVSEEEAPLNLVFSTLVPDEEDETLNRFETGVSYVASLAHLWREIGHTFSFYSGEFETVVSVSGEHYDELMEYLACVSPSRSLHLDPGRLGSNTIVFAAGATVSNERVWWVDYLEL